MKRVAAGSSAGRARRAVDDGAVRAAVRAGAAPARVDRRGLEPLRPGPLGAPDRGRRHVGVGRGQRRRQRRPRRGVRQAAGMDGRAGRAGRPLPRRQHLQGRHGHRRPAARRTRPARPRPGRRHHDRPAPRRRPARPAVPRRHRPPAALAHVGTRDVRVAHVRGHGRLVPDGGAAGPRRRPRRRAGLEVHVLERGLLPPGPARRARHGTLLRGRRQRAAAGPARHRRDAAGRHERRAGRRGLPLAEAEPQLHGRPRPGRIVGRDGVGRRQDHRLARRRQAGLPSAVAGPGRRHAQPLAVPVLARPLVRPRPDLLHRRDVGSHRHARERPRHGAAPQRRHHVVDPRRRRHAAGDRRPPRHLQRRRSRRPVCCRSSDADVPERGVNGRRRTRADGCPR